MDCRQWIYSNSFFDYITDFPIDVEREDVADLCYIEVDNRYSVLYIGRSSIPDLATYFFDYQSIPKLYGLMQIQSGVVNFNANNLIASGITQVQQPPLSLTGRGVVLCFIDTGIDYTNELFQDANGNTRILSIWDQTIENGVPPEGYVYGAEYSREQIQAALEAADSFEIVPSRDTNGHGSAMASAAAGSRTANFLGAAPEADIVVVKLKEAKQYLRDFYIVPSDVPAYQENDIMLAVKYADSFADTFERPVVICLGVGTNMGDHAGSSVLSEYLNTVAIRRSRAVVVCGGNEGNAAHHFQGQIALTHGDRSAQNAGERGITGAYAQDVQIRVGDNNRGFFLELWGNVPDIFNVSIRSPGGEVIPATRLNIGQSITYGFIYERTRVTVNASLVEPASGEELILFRFQEPTAGIWTIRVETVGEVYNGEFHMWLPIREFLNSEVFFLEPNPYMTLTGPTYAGNVISVSTYNASNNSFFAESGRGFSRTGAIRPDLAAPGVEVSTYRGNRTGSSMAAALCAGAVAQFLQWAVVEKNNTFVESREIRNYLIRGAEREADLFYPNREWGYGRLNLYETFERLREA